MPGGSGGVDTDEMGRCREPCMDAGEGVLGCLWMWLVRCFCETQRAAFVTRFLASRGLVESSRMTLELPELGPCRRRRWMSGGATVKLPLPTLECRGKARNRETVIVQLTVKETRHTIIHCDQISHWAKEREKERKDKISLYRVRKRE